MTNTYSHMGIFSRQLKGFSNKPLVKTHLLAYGLSFAALLMPTNASASDILPSITNAQSSLISPAEEQRIGKLVAGNLNRLSSSKALAIRLWLTDLVRPLLNHSNLPNKQLQLFLVNDKSVNAFASPGGVIGVHTGLVLQTQQVDELVAVLAHEIAHISQRHYAHRRASEERRAPLYFGAFLASIVVASKVDADMGEAGIYATQAAIVREQMSYSRANEQEADRVGLELMQASQFDVSKMLSMLDMLGSPFAEQDPNWAWARSHPVSEHRVADLAARIEQLPLHQSSSHYQMDLQLLRIMLATQLTDTTKQSLTEVSQQLDPLNDNYLLYQQFAKAMVLAAKREWPVASELLANLSAQHPAQSFIWDQWMQALMAQGQFQAVIAHSQSSAKLGLHATQSYYYQALAYRGLKDMSLAYRALNKLIQAQPLWVGGWQLLAEWSGQTADLATHRVAKAQWHLLRGEFEQAMEQALLGASLATTTDQQRVQLGLIRANAKELKKTVEEL